MDVATVVIPSLISVVLTFVMMIGFYSRWILPYLTDLTNSLPEKIRGNTEPFIDQKIATITETVNTSMTELKGSFRATSNRLNRTMNQAEDLLIGMDIDPEDEDQVNSARKKLEKRYGADVAVEAITRLFTSIAQNQKAEEAQKAAIAAPRGDGWD